MILDNEGQREILLEMLAKMTFVGASIDQIYGLKKAIEEAQVKKVGD